MISGIQYRCNTKMDTIFLNSKNSRTSNPHRLTFNFSDKIHIKSVINILLYQILVSTIHTKQKSHTETMNLKYQLLYRMIKLNYIVDHIRYQILKIFSLNCQNT